MLVAPLVSTCLLGGCARPRRRPAPAPLHALVGPPYQSGGVWRYPRARYDADETGLAIVAGQHGRFAADGAAWDAGVAMGGHPTLQLPCIVRVTNLESGLQIVMRLDDRGPEPPSRLLALTPRAAVLLGPGSEPGVLRVRVQVEDGSSRQLTARLGDPDAPALAVAAAPVGDVRSEALAPPPGVPGRPALAAAPPTSGVAVPDAPAAGPLPESVLRVPVRPTALWIDAGGLGQPRYAELLSGRLAGLGAVVVRDQAGPPELAWRVRIGPLAGVAAADAMLDRALRAGVVDARIIVQ